MNSRPLQGQVEPWPTSDWLDRYYDEAIKAGISFSSISPVSVRQAFKPGKSFSGDAPVLTHDLSIQGDGKDLAAVRQTLKSTVIT
jgi:hypothetical protein